MSGEHPEGDRQDWERRQPVPNLLKLPAHIARQMSPRARRLAAAGLALLVLGAGAAAALFVPDLRSDEADKEEREAAERRALREERIRKLREEQRVMRANGLADDPSAPELERLRRRRALLADLRTSVLSDARARVRSGEFERAILFTRCGPFPRTARNYRPEADLSAESGRYECLAVTAESPDAAGSEGAYIGQPFRALIDFDSGRYAWCKISGVAGEGALDPELLVGVPRACGGRGRS